MREADATGTETLFRDDETDSFLFHSQQPHYGSSLGERRKECPFLSRGRGSAVVGERKGQLVSLSFHNRRTIAFRRYKASPFVPSLTSSHSGLEAGRGACLEAGRAAAASVAGEEARRERRGWSGRERRNEMNQ